MKNGVHEYQCQGWNRLIENDPDFKIRIKEAYSEYQVQGGVTAETLI